MRLNFEGTYEEYVKVFGDRSAAPWAPSVEVPPEVAKHIVETAEAEAKRQAIVRPLRVVEPPPVEPAPGSGSIQVGPFGPAPRGIPPESLTLRVSDAERQMAWETFCEFVKLWATNYTEPNAEQPDRVLAMQSLGTSPAVVGILVMAYELRSLQRLVWWALKATVDPEVTIEVAGGMTASMVQISHVGFPDLDGAYDHGTKWRVR